MRNVNVDGVWSKFLSLALLSVAALAPASAQAQAQGARNSLIVTVPNGYANVLVDDMKVNSTAGAVRWNRVWDGAEWKFNPQWESLSQSWRNLTGSQSADTTAGTVATNLANTAAQGLGNSGGGCWVFVDEDWQPTYGTSLVDGLLPADPMVPARTTPFNRIMGDNALDYAQPQIVSVDYASLCAGVILNNGALRDTEGIRRANELYLGDSGRYAFNNRSVLEKRAVRQLPSADAAVLYASLAAGQIALAPVANPKGFRWIDKSGDWIDYNTQGQVVVWGDKNDNLVWLVRDSGGVLRGAVDATGHVLFSLHYTGELVTEVRDYPAGPGDIAARSVKYQYDAKNRLTSVIDVRGNTTAYDYDVANHIVKLTDQEGRAEQLAYAGDVVTKRTAPDGGVTDYVFEYDDTNKQFASKITGPETAAGRRVEDYTHNRTAKLVRQIVNGRTDVEVSYDTGARAQTITNARGFSTRVSKNEFDQVVQIEYPDGGVLKRSYSAANLMLVEQTDELGVKTQVQYDAKGNPTKLIEAAGTVDERTTDIVVNTLGQNAQVIRRGRTEANGIVTADATWQIDYDAFGQTRKITDAEGNARQFAYSRAGDLVRMVDARGNATSYDVDAGGNLTRITDALGRSRSYRYDKVGNPTQLTDARAKVWAAAYDAMNRPTQSANPVNGTHTVQYNVQGLPIANTDEDGRFNRAEFDNFLRLTKQTDGIGNATQYGYNIADGTNSGTLGTLTDPSETTYPTFTQRLRYDARERPTSSTLLNPNSLGTESLVSSAVYDKRGQLKSDTDANGKVRLYDYDALGQLTQLTDALGNKTKMAYDARGNLIQVTDANSNAHKFEFDRNDRVLRETLPRGQTITATYDQAGNVKTRADANGNKTTTVFDNANRFTEVRQYTNTNALTRTTTFTWDAEDHLTAWSDTDAVRGLTSSAIATYDDAGRKTGETVTYPAGNTLAYGFAYSAAGLKTQLTWPDGTAIGYGYSSHGQLESVTIPGEGAMTVNQFKWLEPTKVTLPGGSTQERALDGLLDLEGLKVKTPGQQTVLSLANSYGKVQELKQSVRTDMAGNASTTKNSGYLYDAETRLTQASVDSGGTPDVETFTLDAVGNRVAHSRVSGPWSYDADNRLTQRGTGGQATTYQYDSAGSLTRKTEPTKTTLYVYDTQNRLIEVQDGSQNPIARYGYDPLDRRIWKEQFRDRSGTPLAQAIRTTYLYADEGLIAEATQNVTLNSDLTVTASGTAVITTQYGPRPDSTFTTAMLFIKTKSTNGLDTVAYYHHDQIGTPLQATDKAGNIVWAATYNAFGQASITTPAATAANPTISSNLRLAGQFEDSETGLYYNWHRYYDPLSGRYTQVDPIGLAGGINRYSYAVGNPLGRVDPDGHFTIISAGIGAVMGGVSAYYAVKGSTPNASFRDYAYAVVPGILTGGLTGLFPMRWLGTMLTGAFGGAMGDLIGQYAGKAARCEDFAYKDWNVAQTATQGFLGLAGGGLGAVAGSGLQLVATGRRLGIEALSALLGGAVPVLANTQMSATKYGGWVANPYQKSSVSSCTC